MSTRLLTYSRYIAAPLALHWRLLQARVDGLLVRADTGLEAEQKSKLPVWAIILIVIAVLCLCCIAVILLAPVILTLLGPSIGNVFSDIVNELETTP